MKLDHQPFYDAIAESPDDPAPIWIYADWLEENGELDLAEFIRASAYHERASDNDPLKVECDIRKRKLRERLRKKSKLWPSDLPLCEGVEWKGFADGMVRGLVLRNYLMAEADRFEQVLRSVPIHTLHISYLNPESTRLIGERPALRRISSLHLGQELARDPHADWPGILLMSPHWTGLKKLSGPLVALAEYQKSSLSDWLDSFDLPRLESLSIEDSIVLSHDFYKFVHSQALGRLRALRLHFQYFSPESLELLLSSPRLQSLRELHIHRGHFDDDCARVLARSPKLANLSALSVSFTQISDAGAEAIADSPYSKGLVNLNLSWNRIRDPGFQALLRLSQHGTLAKLDLTGNMIVLNDPAIALSESTSNGLVSLMLNSNAITQSGGEILASAPWLDRLSELQLNGNHLKESVAILANRTAPNSWRRLWLQGTFTEFSGGLALLESPGLSNLNELDISDNHKIQASLEKRLRERFGDDSLLEGPKRTIEL